MEDSGSVRRQVVIGVAVGLLCWVVVWSCLTLVGFPQFGAMIGPEPLRSPTPTPKPRYVASRAPSATTAPSTTPSSTPASPTPGTPTPDFEFRYVEGSMSAAPNCGTVFLEGVVVDVDGRPLDGMFVILESFDSISYAKTGARERGEGRFGFAPLSPEYYHIPTDFIVTLTRDPRWPAPLSSPLTISFQGCEVAGQFTDITFQES